MITIDFEKRGDKSLTDFLYLSIKNMVLDGNLKENEKLPSKRALSLHLGVSVMTVQNAYIQLIDEGFIFSIEKKGYFVSDIARHFKKSDLEKVSEKVVTGIKRPQENTLSFFADFTSNAAVPGKFPFNLWSRTMRQVLASENEKLLMRTDVLVLLNCGVQFAGI